MASFRLAFEEEDERLARILYNAFLFAPEANWWYNLASPLPNLGPAPFRGESLSSTQLNRLELYRSCIRMVRMVGGSVYTATPPNSEEPAAALCWLPPHIRPTFKSLWQSGLIRVFSRLGFRGLYHFIRYRFAQDQLYGRSLAPSGYSESEGAFVEIIGTAPVHAGRGYSAKLLQWQIEQHEQCFPDAPIFLDTDSEYGKKIYERLRFRALGQMTFEFRTDENGFRKEGRTRDRAHTKWVMMREPTALADFSLPQTTAIPRRRRSIIPVPYLYLGIVLLFVWAMVSMRKQG